MEAQIEEEEAEIVELKSWSTRNKFKDKPQPGAQDTGYKKISPTKKYADYYYSTKYYSRQAVSPLGKKYDTT